MAEEKLIVAGGVLVIAVGFLNGVLNNKPLTPVFEAGLIFIFMSAALSMIPQISGLMAAIVMLAVLSIMLDQLPALLAKVGK